VRDEHFEALETPRLRIRRFRPDDVEAFAAYRIDPEVARYQGWSDYSLDQADRFIASLAGQCPGTAGEWFQFAVAELGSDSLIGDCALHPLPSGADQAELGFTFARSAWGQGFAREAAASLLRYGFETLALGRIFAIVDERNTAARRLLEVLEFGREATLPRQISESEGSRWLLYARLGPA
jgi:RimJ/RimL family protein N-acetyltransferase